MELVKGSSVFSSNVSSMRRSVSSPDEKPREESWKYDARWSMFDEFRGVSSDD